MDDFFAKQQPFQPSSKVAHSPPAANHFVSAEASPNSTPSSPAAYNAHMYFNGQTPIQPTQQPPTFSPEQMSQIAHITATLLSQHLTPPLLPLSLLAVPGDPSSIPQHNTQDLQLKALNTFLRPIQPSNQLSEASPILFAKVRSFWHDNAHSTTSHSIKFLVTPQGKADFMAKFPNKFRYQDKFLKFDDFVDTLSATDAFEFFDSLFPNETVDILQLLRQNPMPPSATLNTTQFSTYIAQLTYLLAIHQL